MPPYSTMRFRAFLHALSPATRRQLAKHICTTLASSCHQAALASTSLTADDLASFLGSLNPEDSSSAHLLLQLYRLEASSDEYTAEVLESLRPPELAHLRRGSNSAQDFTCALYLHTGSTDLHLKALQLHTQRPDSPHLHYAPNYGQLLKIPPQLPTSEQLQETRQALSATFTTVFGAHFCEIRLEVQNDLWHIDIVRPGKGKRGEQIANTRTRTSYHLHPVEYDHAIFNPSTGYLVICMHTARAQVVELYLDAFSRLFFGAPGYWQRMAPYVPDLARGTREQLFATILNHEPLLPDNPELHCIELRALHLTHCGQSAQGARRIREEGCLAKLLAPGESAIAPQERVSLITLRFIFYSTREQHFYHATINITANRIHCYPGVQVLGLRRWMEKIGLARREIPLAELRATLEQQCSPHPTSLPPPQALPSRRYRHKPAPHASLFSFFGLDAQGQPLATARQSDSEGAILIAAEHDEND